jgi:hypothetical protein
MHDLGCVSRRCFPSHFRQPRVAPLVESVLGRTAIVARECGSGHTKIRAEFWNVSYTRCQHSVAALQEGARHTVTRDRCFIETPPSVPDADLTTMMPLVFR